jgi:hypothetical protein
MSSQVVIRKKKIVIAASYLPGQIDFSMQRIPTVSSDEISRSIPSRASSGARYKNSPPEDRNYSEIEINFR